MSKNILLYAIKGYQFFSRLTPPNCRFYPTCSDYSFQAIQRYGTLRGIFIGTKRLLKCHPFHRGGYDPLL